MEEPVYRSGVREMPLDERPRERLDRLGAEALSDAELIAILLRSGTPKLNAVALAQRVVHHFKDLRSLSRASVKEITQVHGMGKVKAIEIKAALELGKRLAKHQASQSTRIRSAEDVATLLMVQFKDYETEHFTCLHLTAKNDVVRIEEISKGALDATLAIPRDVFCKAVRDNAHAIIVCHNHPSGDPEPSREDIELTHRLTESAKVLGIRFLDHVIFGDGRYVSLAERGYIHD